MIEASFALQSVQRSTWGSAYLLVNNDAISLGSGTSRPWSTRSLTFEQLAFPEDARELWTLFSPPPSRLAVRPKQG